MTIERRSLRAQIREELLSRMRNGHATPGESINEVQLAHELGVSRTPLREALIALESEGQIRSESGRGFHYTPFSTTELEQLAPVIATLECLGLDLTARADLKELAPKLLDLANSFPADAATHSMIIRRDDEWHELMLSRCPNSQLLARIKSVRQDVHRYEALLVSDEAIIRRSAEEHAGIAEHLAAGNPAKAKRALTANWTGGVRRLIDAWESTDR